MDPGARPFTGYKSWRYPPSRYYYQAYASTPESRAAIGTSWAAASPEQRTVRREQRLIGRGRYKFRSGYGRSMAPIGGRGAYWGDVGSKVGGFLGSMVPGGFGGAVGSWLGQKLGDAGNETMKSWTGRGAYKRMRGRGAYTGGSAAESGIVSNNIMDVPGAGPSIAAFGASGGTVRITHREFISNIYAPPDANFLNTQYPINPGLFQTFPWLSQIAQNFDEYTAIQVAFTYRSMVTDFAANSGQVGTVILATQYNNNEQPFNNARQMLNYDGAMSSKTSQTGLQGVECDPAKLSMGVGKYIRAGPVTTQQDLNTLDSGIFNLAIEGVPTTYFGQKMGELWVAYTFELRKPKEFVSLGYSIDQDIFVIPRAVYDTQGDPAVGAALQSALLTGQANSIGSELTFSQLGVAGDILLTFTLPERAEGAYELVLFYDATQTSEAAVIPNQLQYNYNTNTMVPGFANPPIALDQIHGFLGTPAPVALTPVAVPVVFYIGGSGTGVTAIGDIITPQLQQNGGQRLDASSERYGWYATAPSVGTWTSNAGAAGTCAALNPVGADGLIASQYGAGISAGNHSIGVLEGIDGYNAALQGIQSTSTFVYHFSCVDNSGTSNIVTCRIVGSGNILAQTLSIQATVRQYNPLGNSQTGAPVLVNNAGQVVIY